jgi:hypothetical protein
MKKSDEEKILDTINKQPDRKEKKEEKESKKEAEEEFDLDEALNEPAFVDFLAKFPDAETMEMVEGNKKIMERYFAFKDQKQLSKALKGVFVNQINLESGVQMNEGEFDNVDEYIEKMSIEDQGRFEKVLKSKQMFERSIEELQKTQLETKEILGKLNKSDLQEKIKDLKYVKSSNFIKTLFDKEARDKKKGILEKYEISGSDAKEALEIETKKVETLEKLESLQQVVLKQFVKAQETLLSKELEPLQEARQKVLEKIMSDLAIVDGKNEKANVEELDKVAEKIRSVEASGNYIPEYEENLEMLKKDLEEMTKKLLERKIEETVLSFTNNKISTLEASLQTTFEKMTGRGLKTPENKELVLKKLMDLAEAEKSLPKKLLIKRIIIKFKK